MVYHVQFPGLGLDLTINRVALAIGGFNIYWYGVIIAAGMLLAMLYAFRNAVDYGIDSDRLVDVVAIGTVMAIVCARIYYVAMAPFEYQSLWEMIDIRKGGIAIYGAVIGAFVFGGLAAKWRKVPLLPLFDLVSLGFLIGQGIGRWGNFVNQEAFGLPITNKALQFFPFGVYITDPSGVESEFRDVVYSHIQAGGGGNWFCATFFYEGVWNTIGAIFCVWMWKRNYQKDYPGILMIFYLFWYCIGRFWLEFLRMDAVPVTKTACLIVAILALIIGVLYILARTSRLAYLDVRKAAQAGATDAVLTDYEVKNYKFVGKLFEKAASESQKSSDKASKFFAELLLKIGYIRKNEPDYIVFDFENTPYYHVPKDYKRRFKAMKKQDVYCA